MSKGIVDVQTKLEKIIEQELKPYVKKIDIEAFYAEKFLKKLGEAGLFSSEETSQQELLLNEMHVVEETAKVCMTTAFCLWCHLAALTYVRKTKNENLRNTFLPLLEGGEILGATGLSNPMKYYGGLEDLHLRAEKTVGGYILSGTLPAVSNLAEGHWFGVIAGINDNEQIMCLVPWDAEGLTFKEKIEFLGVNGSATFACQFNHVFIPSDWLLSENASEFVAEIRPSFMFYQIPLGLGVSKASIYSIDKVVKRQNGCNRFLKKQSDELEETIDVLSKRVEALFANDTLNWKDIAEIRLDTAYLTLDAVQVAMLHNGSAGYLKDCAPARRLREAYFFANLTPTIKHLENILCSG